MNQIETIWSVVSVVLPYYITVIFFFTYYTVYTVLTKLFALKYIFLFKGAEMISSNLHGSLQSKSLFVKQRRKFDPCVSFSFSGGGRLG